MKFLIVDDHPIMRLGVRALVAQAWPEAEIVEAETVSEAAATFAIAATSSSKATSPPGIVPSRLPL